MECCLRVEHTEGIFNWDFERYIMPMLYSVTLKIYLYDMSVFEKVLRRPELLYLSSIINLFVLRNILKLHNTLVRVVV